MLERSFFQDLLVLFGLARGPAELPPCEFQGLPSRIFQSEEQVASGQCECDAVAAVVRAYGPPVTGPIGGGQIAVGLKHPARWQERPRNNGTVAGIVDCEQSRCHGHNVKNCLGIPTESITWVGPSIAVVPPIMRETLYQPEAGDVQRATGVPKLASSEICPGAIP